MKTSNAVRLAVLAMAMIFLPAVSHAGFVLSIGIAPPPIPVYAQPVIPGDGYMWTPGYWQYGPAGYVWVPGAWVLPPQAGLLWTPGYWGWRGGLYVWNAGYWGPHVGFYGGVNYGYGYGGVGFAGGRWVGGHFAYNAAVANVNVGFIHNTYRENVMASGVRTSYNGGAGGLRAMPSAQERMAMNEHHFGPTGPQNAHHESAFASANRGRPGNAAMNRPRAAGPAARPAARPAEHPAGHPAAMNHAAPAGHAGPAAHGAPAGHGAPAHGAANKGAAHGAHPEKK